MRSPLRAGIALACVLGLSACGGSESDVYIGGSVSGVTKSGMVLTNNGGSDLPIKESGPFNFMVEADSSYNIAVKTPPSNVESADKCVVTGGIGRAVYSVNNIKITCTIWERPLGGQIYGLAGATGLVLVNGSDQQVITPDGTDPQKFQMAKVSEESPYGVTILKQPTGRNCSIENGVGRMAQAPVENIVVRCTK